MRLSPHWPIRLLTLLSLLAAPALRADTAESCTPDSKTQKFCDDSEPVKQAAEFAPDPTDLPAGCGKAAFELGFKQGAGGQRHYGNSGFRFGGKTITDGNSDQVFNPEDERRAACKGFSADSQGGGTSAQSCCQSGFLKGALRLTELLAANKLVGKEEPSEFKCQMDYQKGLLDGANECSKEESSALASQPASGPHAKPSAPPCPQLRKDGMFYLGCYHIGFYLRLANCQCPMAKNLSQHIIARESGFKRYIQQDTQSSGSGATANQIESH